MRFLILTQYFHPEIGAAQVRLAAMIRELLRQGHSVEVVTAMPNYATGEIFPQYRNRFFMSEAWEGVPVYRTWIYAATGAGVRRMLNYGSFTLSSLVGLFQAKRPDYVFVESPPPFLGLPARLAAIRWQVPFIYNVADLWLDVARDLGIIRDGLVLRLAERLERWTLRRAAYVTAVTEGLRSILITRKKVPPHKVLLLPNGVDTELFKPQPPNVALAKNLGLEDKRVILYAGTHGYAHAVEVAIRAAKLLENEDITFVFIGDGSEKPSLVQMAREIGLKNALFLNPVPVEQIPLFYSFAAAGLSTLRNVPLFDGTRPAKIFAAMACGKPVLYSGSGEGARLVEKARAGIVVAPEDPQALAAATLKLVGHPDLALELGQNGRRYVLEHLSWSRIVENWLRQLPERNNAK